MAIPASFEGRLALPAIAAPMFLVSGPDLVVEACRSGVVGTFPSLNRRSTAGYADWLAEIRSRLSKAAPGAGPVAPYGVNLIVHKSNARLEADLAVTVEHEVPLVVTSLGARADVVEAVHGYGGIVFHDVVNLRHARKAAEAGVDGLIAVSAGAGGHCGTLNPFALVSEISAFFGGTVVLAGAIASGHQIAAARMMGADLAYLGSRFIATRESLVGGEQKRMMVASAAADILLTPEISGIPASFMKDSLIRAGFDPDRLAGPRSLDIGKEERAWKNVWSAGQGVGSIRDIPATADLCRRLATEYREAMQAAKADPFAGSG